MYCSNCGAEASGNFCAKCGAPLKAQAAASAPPPSDWSSEVRYDTLIHIPEVRDAIARAAATKQKRMSGQEFLAAAQKVLPVHSSVPLATAANMGAELAQALGIKTGKTHSETLQIPPGKAIVAALCALACSGQEVRHVEQLADGCLLEASIPSDMWSFEGTLYLRIRGSGHESQVDATTKINQLYDWGKSTRFLDQLFEALKGAA